MHRSWKYQHSVQIIARHKTGFGFSVKYVINCCTCLKWSVALVLFLAAPPLSGPFVGASPNIQTRLYDAWPVVDDGNYRPYERGSGRQRPLTAKVRYGTGRSPKSPPRT